MPKFIDRIFDNLAERVVKRSISRRLTDPIMAEIVGWRQDETRLTKPYSQQAVVYACVAAKARNIAQVPFKLYSLGSKRDDEITSGTIYDLFRNPNPTVSRFQLWEALITSIDLTGEWFIVYDAEVVKGVPVFIWPLPGSMFKPWYVGRGKGVWAGWTLRRNGTELNLTHDELIFDKYYNPYDEVRGLTPLDAAKLSLESDFDAMRFNRNFFKNDATPAVTFETEQHLNDAQYERLKHQIIDSRRGVANAHRALLLDSGVTANQLSISQKDMQFLQQRQYTRDEICMIYKVPKAEIAVYEDVNYATALSADRSFWLKTLVPLMTRIEDKINSKFLNRFGIEGFFDLKAIDALNYAFLEKIDGAVKLYQIGFTRNELNARMDLGFEDADWGDEPFAGPGVDEDLIEEQQAEDVQKTEPEKEEDQDEDEEEREKVMDKSAMAQLLEAKRGEIWRSLQSRTSPIRAKCAKDLKNYFHGVEVKLLGKLGKAIEQKADITDRDVDAAFSDEKIKKLVEKYITLAMDTGITSVVGGSFDLTDPKVLSRIADRAQKVKVVNDTAREGVRSAIKKAVSESLEAGLSELETSDLIKSYIGDAMKVSRHRANTIARTEVHGAYSEGRYEAMESTAPVAKRWISSRDANVRDSHRDLDGSKTDWGGTFRNGLRYPLDPLSNDPSEVINCRCELVPIYKGEE